MAVDEASRLRLYDAARRTLGEDEAGTLMSGLAPVGFDWTQLATKSDLFELEQRLDSKFEARLRAEVGSLRGSFEGELGSLRGDMGSLRGELGLLEARMLDRMAAQTRAIMLGMVASNATLVGLVFGALRLGG